MTKKKTKSTENEWQSIPLDFFKEIMADYFKKDSKEYEDVIIEIKTPNESVGRFFMDNTSYKEVDSKVMVNSFIEDNIKKKDDIISPFAIEKIAKNLVGSLVIVKKEVNPFIKMAQEILKDKVDLLNSGVDENILNELSNSIIEATAPVEYPLTNNYLYEFLFKGLIISVPPNQKNETGCRPEPLWFLKRNGEEISGDNLKEEDWKTDLSDKYIKIRSFKYSDFKENILGKRGK